MSATTSNDIFNVNPYEANAGLSALESEVLWEYAKLAQHIKLVGGEWHLTRNTTLTATIAHSKDEGAQ